MSIDKSTYRQYEEALLSFDRGACSSLVYDQLEREVAIPDIYERLLRPALYDVGAMWEQNKLSVAAEHVATAITEGVMNELYSRVIAAPRKGRLAIIAAVEGEYHQVGAKMVADVFELNGWDALFVGASTPAGEIIRLVRETRPTLLGLSLSVYFNLPSLVMEIESIRAAGLDIPILVGGQALQRGGRSAIAGLDGVYPVLDLVELQRVIDQFDEKLSSRDSYES